MLCLLALTALAALAVFSARYRPLAREALACVGRRVTLRPCTTGFDVRVRAAVVGRVMRRQPALARLLHRHLELFAWAFVALLVASAGWLGHGLWALARYGSCQGPDRSGFCVFAPPGRSRGVGPRGAIPGHGDAPALGPTDARVSVVEFGCYTCPSTRAALAAVDDLLARHGADVRYVFRDFPLDAADAAVACGAEPAAPHAGATRAALAAACAGAQERFWDFHRLLLARPDAIATCDGLERAARDLGLDGARFATCLADPATHARVARDVDDGVRAGVAGTPTFWVNGRRLEAPSPDELERAVVDALADTAR